MTIYGADVEALDGLATQLHGKRDTIVGLLQQAVAQIDGLLWEGPDADALRPDWTERLLKLGVVVEDGLGVIADEAFGQAAEQRAASDT